MFIIYDKILHDFYAIIWNVTFFTISTLNNLLKLKAIVIFLLKYMTWLDYIENLSTVLILYINNTWVCFFNSPSVQIIIKFIFSDYFYWIYFNIIKIFYGSFFSKYLFICLCFK